MYTGQYISRAMDDCVDVYLITLPKQTSFENSKRFMLYAWNVRADRLFGSKNKHRVECKRSRVCKTGLADISRTTVVGKTVSLPMRTYTFSIWLLKYNLLFERKFW